MIPIPSWFGSISPHLVFLRSLFPLPSSLPGVAPQDPPWVQTVAVSLNPMDKSLLPESVSSIPTSAQLKSHSFPTLVLPFPINSSSFTSSRDTTLSAPRCKFTPYAHSLLGIGQSWNTLCAVARAEIHYIDTELTPGYNSLLTKSKRCH